MTCVAEIVEHWFGLCRKPPAIHTLHTGFCLTPGSFHAGIPDGGDSGGPARIGRGIGSALSAMRTLNRNRNLLWFTLLAGLVLVGNTVCQMVFRYIAYNMHIPLNRIAWLFFIEFATLFGLVFLMAGLVLSIPSGKERGGSFFEGLSRAKNYMKTIFGWSFILALAGMLIVIVLSYVPVWFPSPGLLFLYHNSLGHLDTFLFSTLSQFPLNLSGIPPSDIFTEIPGQGGRSELLWFYFGFREALFFSAINLLLFVLTPFVVPNIIVEKKNVWRAVAGSFAMMKKAWVEIAACAVLLGIIVYGAFLTCHIFQTSHGMMVMPLTTFYRPTDAWIALGFFYDLALFSAAFIIATVGGIAALDLYNSAKSGQATVPPEQ